MFDTKTKIDIPAPYRLGDEKLSVRWPTDAEWAARARARKIIIKRLGRGKSETKVPEPGEADLTLYSAISLNGSPEITAAEAAMVLEAMAQATVTGVAIDQGAATIEMETMAGHVTHKAKIPTADQILQWRRGAYRMIDLQYGHQEIRTNPEAGAQLWDACEGKSEDYANGVPGLHKDAAIRALIDYIDQNWGPNRDDDANF